MGSKIPDGSNFTPHIEHTPVKPPPEVNESKSRGRFFRRSPKNATTVKAKETAQVSTSAKARESSNPEVIVITKREGVAGRIANLFKSIFGGIAKIFPSGPASDGGSDLFGMASKSTEEARILEKKTDDLITNKNNFSPVQLRATASDLKSEICKQKAEHQKLMSNKLAKDEMEWVAGAVEQEEKLLIKLDGMIMTSRKDELASRKEDLEKKLATLESNCLTSKLSTDQIKQQTTALKAEKEDFIKLLEAMSNEIPKENDLLGSNDMIGHANNLDNRLEILSDQIRKKERLNHAKRVCQEAVSTEASLLQNLRAVLDGSLTELKTLCDEPADQAFLENYIEAITNYTNSIKALHSELVTAQKSLDEGDYSRGMVMIVQAYARLDKDKDYVSENINCSKMYKNIMAISEKIKDTENPKYDEIEANLRKKTGNLAILDIASQPMQRLPRLSMLLGELEKKAPATEKAELGRAQEKLKESLKKLNSQLD